MTLTPAHPTPQAHPSGKRGTSAATGRTVRDGADGITRFGRQNYNLSFRFFDAAVDGGRGQLSSMLGFAVGSPRHRRCGRKVIVIIWPHLRRRFLSRRRRLASILRRFCQDTRGLIQSHLNSATSSYDNDNIHEQNYRFLSLTDNKIPAFVGFAWHKNASNNPIADQFFVGVKGPLQMWMAYRETIAASWTLLDVNVASLRSHRLCP